jgi:hypothetical protein
MQGDRYVETFLGHCKDAGVNVNRDFKVSAAKHALVLSPMASRVQSAVELPHRPQHALSLLQDAELTDQDRSKALNYLVYGRGAIRGNPSTRAQTNSHCW